MPKHTPGPWWRMNGGKVCGDPKDPEVVCDHPSHDVMAVENQQQCIANGDLLAAAPDLLEALEECDVAFATLNIGRDHGITPQADAAMKAAWTKLWEAKSKAKGQPNHFAEANPDLELGIYTVFRDDQDELTEGFEGMWNLSFRYLRDAKLSCEETVRSLYDDIDEPQPESFEWDESTERSDCWVLSDDATGSIHTIMKTEVQ